MRLATVLGQVVSTVKQPGLANFTLLLVRDVTGADTDAAAEAAFVAVDLIGAGAGEVVLVVCGGAARVAAGAQTPTDLAVVAIVDTVSRDGVVTYQKA